MSQRQIPLRVWREKETANRRGSCLAGHVLMENRSGIIVDTAVIRTVGAPEWEVALQLLDGVPGSGPKTVGGDRGYDNGGFIAGCRARRITRHVAQFPHTATRKSAIDARTTRHPGYRWSQRVRKRVEEGFGWLKTVGTGRKLRYIGVAPYGSWMALTTAPGSDRKPVNGKDSPLTTRTGWKLPNSDLHSAFFSTLLIRGC